MRSQVCSLLRADTAVQAVVAEYDAYMGSAMPSPSLLPAVVTVTVPSKGWRFQLKLRPTDYLRDVIECVGEKVAQGFGEQIQSFAPDCRWSIADAASVGAGAGTSNTIFFTDDTPLYTQCPGNRSVSAQVVCVHGFVVDYRVTQGAVWVGHRLCRYSGSEIGCSRRLFREGVHRRRQSIAGLLYLRIL